ncbi:MAG: NUDIX hydrolase [Flavobacterium sp.]|nr:MAG: NUDIX hydrolase [Flavobacterium sp.]
MKYLIDISKDAWNRYLPHISVDCVVFGFHDGEIKVLLLKMKDTENWLLPGGYLLKNEAIDDAAYRVLKERSGADKIFLHQFGVMGSPNRSQEFFKDFDDDLWHKQRFITIGYYALVDNTKINTVLDELSDSCEWKPLKQLPDMGMDHESIIEKAIEALRSDLNYKPIGYNLLPPEFTMPELQRLYETILNKPLNRGNFYRKMLSFKILKKLDEPRKGAAHKSPNLYQFDPEKYESALKGGLQSNW